MSMPTQRGVPLRTDELAVLWNRVVEARGEMTRERQLSGGTGRSPGRAAFLNALEDYVASRTKRGHPIPYALRDELVVHRLGKANLGVW